MIDAVRIWLVVFFVICGVFAAIAGLCALSVWLKTFGGLGVLLAVGVWVAAFLATMATINEA